MKRSEILILIIISISMLPAILLVSGFNRSLDVTDRKIYTLKGSTEKIFKQFDQPLYLTWWKSDEFQSPQLDIAEDLFLQIPQVAGSSVSAEIKTPSDEDKERLRKLGFPEEQIDVSDDGKVKQLLIFSGIEISYLDKSEIVPFTVKPELLEFQIAEAMIRIKNQKMKSVVIFPDDLSGNSNGSYTLLTAGLSGYFHVLSVNDENPITFIPDVMIVPDRRNYTLDELFAIDRAIQTGSSVIFFSDGLKIDPVKNDNAVTEDSTIIRQWLESYGIDIGNALISDANSLFLNYASGTSRRYNNYPMWFQTDKMLNMLWASPIIVREMSGLEFEIITESSDSSWLNEYEVDIRPDISKDNYQFTGPYITEVEIYGNFKPLFQSSQVSEGKGRILLFSSTLSFSDFMQSSGSFKNIDYLRNSIYRLTGESELYEIATSSYHENLLHRDTLINGKGIGRIIFINFAIVPLILLIIYSLALRKRKKNRGG